MNGLESAKEGRVSGGQGLDGGPHVIRTKLQQLQEADGELAKIAVKEGFYRRDGLLYRRWIPRATTRRGDSGPDHPSKRVHKIGPAPGPYGAPGRALG